MSTVWSVVPQITSGIALLAFGLAIAAWVYRTRLIQRERIIRSAAETDRGRLVESALEFFHVSTEGLTREQKYHLALEQVHARERRFLGVASLISLAAILLAAVSGFAISHSSEAPKSTAITSDEARKRIEAEIRYRIEPVRNLFDADSINPLVQANLSFVVFTSTPPSQHNFMISQRRNVYAEFLDTNLESLFLQLSDIARSSERAEIANARYAARRFDALLHNGPKREVNLASHVIDDITILDRAQVIAIRDTIIPALRPWLP